MPRSTFTTWTHGYERKRPGGARTTGAPVLTRVGSRGIVVPFIGLAEGLVLAAFRETGIPLQRIRPALDRLAEEHALEHALASEHLYSDGAEVLYDYARSRGDKQLGLLTVVRTGQRVFHDVIDRYLSRLRYDGGWASSLWLPVTEDHILLADPRRAFGQPMFATGGARLADVRGRVRAGEDLTLVARDYGVPEEQVREALAAPTLAAAA